MENICRLCPTYLRFPAWQQGNLAYSIGGSGGMCTKTLLRHSYSPNFSSRSNP